MRLVVSCLAAIGTSLFAGNVTAQGLCGSSTGRTATSPPPASHWWETLTKRIELRQNTNTKKDIAQPAFVTFTNPDDKPTTYQIGVGVLASVCPGTGFDVDALLDYQRNTAVGKEQDAFKTGVTGYWRLRDAVALGHSPLVSFRSNFKNDGVKDNQGWQNAVLYTHLFSGQHTFPMPGLPYRFGQASGKRLAALEMVYVPYAGFEFDSVFNAPTEEAKGTAIRGVLQFNLALYPAPLETRSPVEFLIGYAYRGDVKDTTNQTDDSHPLFTFEANYFPIQHEKRGEIGFGVSYKNGENPDESYEKQAFWQFTLKFRLKKP
jgi:hypothetical protein